MPHLVVIAAAVVSLICVAVAVRACSSMVTAPASTPVTAAYNWENLTHDDAGRLTYLVDGEPVSRTGIDVSEHQGFIDWTAVASDGIDFAFVRLGNRGATSGSLNYDDYGAANLSGASQAGLDVGVYFFSQAITEEEAVEEADFVLSQLGDTKLAYPIVYDHEPVYGVEGRADDLSPAQMTANAKAFCDRITQAGYTVMLYGNAADLSRYDLNALANYPVWFAEYDVAAPSRNTGFSIWQYSNAGTVAGIDTAVDLNIAFVNER